MLVAVMVATLAGFSQDKYTINRSDLPEAAQEFLTEHFPNAKVSMVKTDKHLLKRTDYDVKLVNGTKIEFSNSGKWTSVDCGKRAVPETIIPRAIRRYVEKNHSDLKIVKIEKTSSRYNVTLSNGASLPFSLLGQYKG